MALAAQGFVEALSLLLQLSLKFSNIKVSLGDCSSHSTAEVPDAEPDRHMLGTHTPAQ